MGLYADSSPISFRVQGALSRATQWLSALFTPAAYSAEEDLVTGPLRDARLAPRVAMHANNLDAGTLSLLSGVGMRYGKQVTAESHPELMQAWEAMSTRSGRAKAPQLIIVDSPTVNALTLPSNQEVAITTGLLRILDLRETVAVLGHELGHATSDHIKPRLVATLGLTGLGAVAGREAARAGLIERPVAALLNKWGPTQRLLTTLSGWGEKIYGTGNHAKTSVLRPIAYIAAGMGLGGILARKLTVHSTELDADTKGASISGDPRGLALALAALEAHREPGFMSKLAEWKSGYPSAAKRIEHLNTLADTQESQGFTTQQTSILAQVPDQVAPAHNSVTVKSVSHVASAERMGTPVAALAHG